MKTDAKHNIRCKTESETETETEREEKNCVCGFLFSLSAIFWVLFAPAKSLSFNYITLFLHVFFGVCCEAHTVSRFEPCFELIFRFFNLSHSEHTTPWHVLHWRCRRRCCCFESNQTSFPQTKILSS